MESNERRFTTNYFVFETNTLDTKIAAVNETARDRHRDMRGREIQAWCSPRYSIEERMILNNIVSNRSTASRLPYVFIS